MKKIPTLFKREFRNHKVYSISSEIMQGMEWVLNGEGVATEKIDGSCCAIIDGKFYKRYDSKKGRKPPENSIACCDPDSITGHWPHWVLVDYNNSNDKWFVIALNNTPDLKDGTYEAIGPHFQGNPYGLCDDILEPHGVKVIDVARTFEGIRNYLSNNLIEGIVFWKDGEPQCKIKRTDFGFEWPLNKCKKITA